MGWHRMLLFLFCNALLLTLVQLLNSTITWTGLYLYVGGLYVVFAAMQGTLRTGLAAAMLTGLLVDALHPVPFGTSMILFSLAFLFAWYVGGRLDEDSSTHFAVLALVLNIFLFLAYALWVGAALAGNIVWWGRLGTDLLASSLAIAVIGKWFFHFQMALMRLFGVARDKKQESAA